MRTTTYICDICKQSKSQDDLVEVKISFDTKGRYRPESKKDICKECLKKRGLLLENTENPDEETRKSNQKTIESKIVDILEDLGVQFCE
jgi:hypothetical protein